MFEPLLGSLAREQVLLFIHLRSTGYAREISRYFGLPVDSVQKQLKRLKHADLLTSRTSGRTVIYEFNTKCPYLEELRWLLTRMASICRASRTLKLPGPADKNNERKYSDFAIVKRI
ncbi:MAG: ArsR family transcriptional regulator [Candidatus Aegiribacteria sp.]|nr:ArsR family transcriptional regulator [Candidatus Aegiribacteria sp.]MBD3295262.1 ArsR family transcriptional regulator [Candidatus Fermentibacteria bacterium]